MNWSICRTDAHSCCNIALSQVMPASSENLGVQLGDRYSEMQATVIPVGWGRYSRMCPTQWNRMQPNVTESTVPSLPVDPAVIARVCRYGERASVSNHWDGKECFPRLLARLRLFPPTGDVP